MSLWQDGYYGVVNVLGRRTPRRAKPALLLASRTSAAVVAVPPVRREHWCRPSRPLSVVLNPRRAARTQPSQTSNRCGAERRGAEVPARQPSAPPRLL